MPFIKSQTKLNLGKLKTGFNYQLYTTAMDSSVLFLIGIKATANVPSPTTPSKYINTV